jgi:cell division protein FtsZ
MLKTDTNPVLVLGIGKEGKTSLEYMKGSGIPGVDFLIPDENLTARDLLNYKLVFLTGGLPDQQTSGMAIHLASVAKELQVLTIGIMTMPLPGYSADGVGPGSGETAALKDAVDLLILISPNPLQEPDDGPSLRDLHEHPHFQVWLAVKTVVDLMSFNGIVGVDFEDVRSISRGGGYGFLSFGQASGENRVSTALRMAMKIPPGISDHAGNVLLYIYYGTDEITMVEIGEILEFFQTRVPKQYEIIWNCGYDPDLEHDLRITVIRTGLDQLPRFR